MGSSAPSRPWLVKSKYPRGARMYGNEGVGCGSRLACGKGVVGETLGGLGGTLGDAALSPACLKALRPGRQYFLPRNHDERPLPQALPA